MQHSRHCVVHRINQPRARRQQNRLRRFVVLGLREQVHCHPVGMRAVVGDHQDLRRTGDHVDADDAEHAPLRGRDVRIAGTDDLVDLRNRLGAVRKRADRLRAPNRNDTIDPRDVRGGEHQRIALARGCRHHHDQLADARYARRDCIHQHRRRIRRLAAGDVKSDAFERRHLLSQSRAIVLCVRPRRKQLMLVKGADALRRGVERVAL